MRCCVASVALAAFALLLAPAPAACEPTAHKTTTNCTLLADINAKICSGRSHSAGLEKTGWRARSVSYRGQAATVTLHWGSDPARAGAALLGVLLRHVRLYRGVRLAPAPAPLSTRAFALAVPFRPSAGYTDLVIGLSTAWEPEMAQQWVPRKGSAGGLAGPRLAEFDISPVPARRRLFARLAPAAAARAPHVCQRHVRWTFYANDNELALCGFHQGNLSAVEVLVVSNYSAALLRLQERAAAASTTLHVRLVNRTVFLRTLHTANHSFLFLDYDMWEGAPSVSVVEPPPCATVDFNCTQELDSAIAMRVADVDVLQTYAPQLFQFVHDFKPSPESLRLILEREASGVDIEEAACEWALKHKSNTFNKSEFKKYDLHEYNLAIYLCIGDPNNIQYDPIFRLMVKQIFERTFEVRCEINLMSFQINCSDNYNMSKWLDHVTRTAGFYNLLGVVSLSVEGAAAASAGAAASRVPLLLADVVPEEGAAAPATWRVAGRPRHIARALRHFVLQSGWRRLAVLSQPTKLATDYYAALQTEHKADISLGEFQIPLHLTERQTKEALQNLEAANARIVFVNADSEAAVKILEAAVASRMSYADGFVWIVRDWRQNNVVCGTKHFTVSFWSRGVEDFPPANGQASLSAKLSKLWPGRPWPPHAVSLANALLTLSMGFVDVFRRFPNTQQDLRSDQVISALNESLIETPVTGVSQVLRYKERSLEETFVFVDQWCGSELIQRLATWRVNASSGAVRGKSEPRANYTRPADMPRDDGTSGCIVRSGDAFDPDCHDRECACALLLLALAPVALLLVRRRLARLKQEQQIQVIARRRHVATVLAAYLVERDALELLEELGAGRFGSVRLARLRVPARNPRYIAAKALRDDAAPSEESEFLREACTIASLEHAHVVRLVGVCISDGPPLVLMELAFFGDLLGYLRARRYLVEGPGSEVLATSGEAEHVSAEALTRLAREAAEALQYLGVRGVVHRDVRAANCLVDVRRSLKLADFGMARDTVAGADGAPEYACRRRGLFPVLWMAPESLAYGVFSAASDVWALGVLVLELVTLGMRPYGTMSPLRVLEYVAAGGSPPLPLDATPQTRGLARLCWQRAAERRPSAAEVAAYLAAWPLALRPALLSERDEPADADSGFGDSPSTELLPPDSPLHSQDQLDVLAAYP